MDVHALLLEAVSDGCVLEETDDLANGHRDALALLASDPDELLDHDWTKHDSSLVVKLLNRLIQRECIDPDPAPRVKHGYAVVSAALPSLDIEDEQASLRFDLIITRLVLASEASLRSTRRLDNSGLGAVAFGTTKDKDQPQSGSIIAIRNESTDVSSESTQLPSGAPSIELVRAKMARQTSRARAEPPFSEMATLRAMLFWFVSRGPRTRSPILSAIRSYLVSYCEASQKSPSSSKYPAAAVRSLLQIVFAALRGWAAKGGASGSRMEVDGDEQQNEREPSLSDWLSVLLQLHDIPGTVSDTSSVLSLFHEPLSQCVFLLLTSVQPGDISVETLVSGVAKALAAGWGEATRGNTSKGVLLLHELDQVVSRMPQVVAAAKTRDCHNDAVTDQSLLRSCVLPPVRVMVTDALASDNSRIAQVALGLFRKQPIIDAVIGAAAEWRQNNNKSASAAQAASEAQTEAGSILGDALVALLRGHQPHWNATVNKQTAAVLTSLADAGPEVLNVELTSLWGDSASGDTADDSSQAGLAMVPPPVSDPIIQRLLPLPPQQLMPSHQPPLVPKPAPKPTASGLMAVMPPPAPRFHPTASGSGSTDGGHSTSSASRINPPLTITGVAPWAVPVGPLMTMDGNGRRPDPPLTITGVAPWAVPVSCAVAGAGLARGGIHPSSAPRPAEVLGSTSNGPVRGTLRPQQLVTSYGALAAGLPISKQLQQVEASVAVTSVPPSNTPNSSSASASSSLPQAAVPAWRARLDRYVARLQPPPPPAPPPGEVTGALGTDGLLPALSSLPVQLPSLGFHDLVFGQELGSGSFSTVKYAKHILRGYPASTWPEYAVKVVSSSVIAALGYEPSVRREVAVLSCLRHPNISRLVSSFRWRDGVYLVLEYAARGDLHSAMAQGGGAGGSSMEPAAAAFLMAEVIAALRAVHALGFAFGDLKPENILLVEDAAGGVHAKLADFGACRPVTSAGEQLVTSSRRVLKGMRDGDWRAKLLQQQQGGQLSTTGVTAAATDNGQVDPSASHGEDDEEDDRVEGTSEYLAPELASGEGRPSVASDAYALGVTIYQLLTGRFPDTDAIWPPSSSGGDSAGSDISGAGAGRKVRFGSVSSASSSCDDGFPVDFPADAKSLVRELLHPDPSQRLGGGPSGGGMDEVAEHAWFASHLRLTSAADVDTLHARTGPRIATGSSSGGGASSDAAWSRRHNSTIWAPLPRTYTAFTSSSTSSSSSGAAGFNGGRRPASSYTVAELLRMEVLPPLL